MIAAGHPEVSVEARCKLLGVARASYYRGPASGLRAGDLELMRQIDKLYLQHPWMGSRSLADQLATAEQPVGRDRVRRLMLRMGIESLSPKPGTSKRHARHPVYPYLLRGINVDRPNQVWATDITYIPMAKGFMYLVAIMDWASRKVLSWRLSNTLESGFCVEALKEALNQYGAPEIFNSDLAPSMRVSSSTIVGAESFICFAANSKPSANLVMISFSVGLDGENAALPTSLPT